MSQVNIFFSKLLKHLAPLGLFVLLPLLVILFLGHNIITMEKDKHISDLSTKIENTLKDIESEIAPESFLLKIGKGAWFTFTQNENNNKELWKYYRKLSNFIKTDFDFYVFDEKGSLVTPNNFSLKSKFLATKLWNSIISDYKVRSDFATKYKKQLKSFVGNEFKLGTFLGSRNILMPIIVNTKDGFIYWMNSDENPKKGILLIFWDVPSYNFRLNLIVNRYSHNFNDIFIKNSDGEILWLDENNKRNKDIYDNIYLRTILIKPPDGYIDSRNTLWKAVKLNDLWLLGGIKSKKRDYDKFLNYFIYFIFLTGIIVFLIYIWIVNKQNLYISIRFKLISLFLIAVITPVMGFSYLGYQYISDMRENLITEFGNESRDILLNIDNELGKSGDIFLEDFRKIVKDFQLYEENETNRKKINDSLAKSDLAFIDRRLASDASQINHITNYVIFDGLSAVSEAFAKCCIDKNLKTNLMDTVDPGLRNAMVSPEANMGNFWLKPDNVLDLMFGSLEFYLYWCFDKTEKGTEFYLVLKMTDTVLREYLQKRLKKGETNPKEKNFEILARNDKNGEWFHDNSISDDLKAISRRLNYMGRPIETQITINSKTYLLLAIKSLKIRGYSFYALYPYEKIENKLIYISKIIKASILFFIIITIAIGSQLAGTFIYPVKCLENGVNAIKERNSEFRIEALQNDEFGSLAQSFNKMISDLKEMQLAKYIQEALLPQNIPQLKGYQLSFSNRMASAIGGDYFDAKLLDKDNLCVIIGDVSGHGVASALVMAIAKAVLYHGFKQTRDLILLFNNLNSVINTYFNKPPVKKMITLFATIIHLPTGKAVFFDAGHNFPMKISKDGSITELKMTGFPVGAQKKIRKKNTEEYTIEEGETVVFYTDGIIEATGKTTEQYGYERFKESLSKMTNENPNTIMKTLFNNYEIWENGTEPDDDVTLIVLKRIASQNNESDVLSQNLLPMM